MVGGTAFALAHNGVLHNDRALRQSLHLPGTKIETDSFVAAQLIQQKDDLNFDGLRYMAEQVEGAPGISPGQTEQLLAKGFPHEEIGDCLYRGEM